MISVDSIFVLITLATILAMYLATNRHNKVWMLLLLWTATVGALSFSGFYLNTESFPPRIVTVFIPTALLVIYLYRIVEIKSLKLGWLIAIHLVRIPVEIILHQVYIQGEIPRIMTYEGFNFDILSGLSAAVVLVLHRRNQLSMSVLKIWNIAALLLLSIIVGLAILSSPYPTQVLAFDQPNMAIFRFPFTWLPAIVVSMVLLAHLFIFKIIRASKE